MSSNPNPSEIPSSGQLVNLEQARKRAKELIRDFRRGDAEAATRFERVIPQLADKSSGPKPRSPKLALHDAQRVIAREHGFESWLLLREHARHLAGFISPDHEFIQALRELKLERVRELLIEDRALVHQRVLGDVSMTGTVWKDGQKVKVEQNHGRFIEPLHFAAFHGHAKLARLLIEFGAGANDAAIIEEDGGQMTPVQLAAWEGDLETLRVILESGAEANIEMPLASALYTAAAHGEKDKVKLLISHGAQLDIFTASMVGDTETIARLLDDDPSLVAQTKQGWTALQGALCCGQPEAAAMLADRGAAVSIEAAAGLGRTEEIAELLSRDPEAANRQFDNQPLLNWALLGGQIQTMKLLLEQGADPNGSDQWGVVPLRSVSAVHGKKGAEIVDLLVAAGADVNRKSRGFTPLAAARKAGNDLVAEALEKHGAKKELRENSFYADWTNSDKHPFWLAVENNVVETVREQLAVDVLLADRDFRPADKLDPHTHRRPIVAASAAGHYEIVQLLIQHGADVDAKSPTEDQREFGMALQLAIENGHYRVANLLLDHGASVDCFPYCDQPMTEVLYELALNDGASKKISQRGFSRYGFQPEDVPVVPEDAPTTVKLLDRVLSLGGQLKASSIVRAENLDLIRALLTNCARMTNEEIENGESLFDRISGAAAWHGYPEISRICMELCPELYTAECARDRIISAVKSHNRDGAWQDYHQLIEDQLKLIERDGKIDELRSDPEFKPQFMIADHYCWPKDYGYRAGVSTSEGMLAIAQLFADWGFDDFTHRDPKSGLTGSERARERLEDGSPAMKELLEFLQSHGAE